VDGDRAGRPRVLHRLPGLKACGAFADEAQDGGLFGGVYRWWSDRDTYRQRSSSTLVGASHDRRTGLVNVERARECGLTDRMQDILVHFAAATPTPKPRSPAPLRGHRPLPREADVGAGQRPQRTEAVALAYDSGVLRTAVEREWRQIGLVA